MVTAPVCILINSAVGFPLHPCQHFLFLIIFLKKILSERERETERERDRERGQAEEAAEGEGEAGFPLSRQPDAGLHPRILGS